MDDREEKEKKPQFGRFMAFVRPERSRSKRTFALGELSRAFAANGVDKLFDDLRAILTGEAVEGESAAPARTYEQGRLDERRDVKTHTKNWSARERNDGVLFLLQDLQEGRYLTTPRRRYCPSYLTWIAARIKARKERCPICGEVAQEAHHEGPSGMGRKPDDFWVVPLCRRCHRMRHDAGIPAWIDTHDRWKDGDYYASRDVIHVVRCYQIHLLELFLSENHKPGRYSTQPQVYTREGAEKRVLSLIEFIEQRHPEWITHKGG